jgi:hypothetical protein
MSILSRESQKDMQRGGRKWQKLACQRLQALSVYRILTESAIVAKSDYRIPQNVVVDNGYSDNALSTMTADCPQR